MTNIGDGSGATGPTDTSDLHYLGMADLRFASPPSLADPRSASPYNLGPKQPLNISVPMDFSTLEEEIMAGGWTRDTAPTGKTPPAKAFTAGARGESQLDNDARPTTFDKSSYHEEDGAP